MKKIIYLCSLLFLLLPFKGISQFSINGDASVILPQCLAGVKTYQLTPSLGSQAGEIWDSTQADLSKPFVVQFEIFLGTSPYSVGADGMAFVMQQQGLTATGSQGGGLGYQGLTPSLAVEFDTYQNGWDPAYCHTAIEKNGDIDHTDLSGNNLAGPVQLSPTNPYLPDGAWHNVEIIWNPFDDSLSVYFDCSFRVGYKGDVVDSIFKGSPNVYWGFTGGTGADFNSQQVCVTNAFTYHDSAVGTTCLRNDGKATVMASGMNSAFTYLWTPSKQTTATATGLTAGVYTVTIYSAGGDSCVKIFDTVRIASSTVSVGYTGAKCSVVNSGKATINIVNGQSPYTYLWSNGVTNQTDTGLAAGKYYVTVTDSKGCKIKDSVTVTTDPPPAISTIPPLQDSVCFTGSTVITGTGGSTYTWAPAAGLSCTNCVSPAASPTVTTTYTITGTDINGCTNTAAITVKVLPLPKPIITGEDTICIGNGTTLSASGGTSYLWNPGSATGSTYSVRPPVSTTYTVKATLDGCSHDTTAKVLVVPVPSPAIAASKVSVCVGDSLTLTGSGGTTYRWSPGNSTNATIHVNLNDSITYTLYAYGGTCEDSSNITLKVIQPVTASIITTHDSICPHQTATISAIASGGTVNYRWSTGATSSSITVKDTVTTTYTATVYGICDSVQKVITVTVVPLPSLMINGKRFRCAGGKDTITVNSSTNPTRYVWNNGQTNATIITGPVNDDTTFTVTAYNSLGCSVTDTFHVTGAGYPIVSLVYPEACGTGNHVTITADTAGGNGPYSYLWSNGSTSDTAVVNVDNSGTIYTLTVTNQFGCLTTATATVVIDNPQLYACCNTTILLGGDTELLASGPGITNYSWTPPNSGLSCYNCPNPTASPTVTTTYTVSGTDSADCPIERTVTIVVETPCYNFIVPNVFTPTNAGKLGLDNVFYIPTHGFTTWSLQIFDRWGKEVYKSTDPNKYWDGTTEGGGNAPEGVYYYVINASCTGNSFQKDGFVQLIR